MKGKKCELQISVPSLFSTSSSIPGWNTATAELVVPKSIPIGYIGEESSDIMDVRNT